MRKAIVAAVVMFCITCAGGPAIARAHGLAAMSTTQLQHRLTWQQHRLVHYQGAIRWHLTRGFAAPAGRPAHAGTPRYRIWWHEQAVRWTLREISETQAVLDRQQAQAQSACGATAEACAWYNDGATQCEVAHEGGWTSVSPNGMYHGRFQMDYQFQHATAYGAHAYDTYGAAEHWPPGVQIQHAYSQYLARGWAPWPPYYAYGCSRYHGGTYGSSLAA